MYVTKANGHRELFDEHKLLRSMRRAHVAKVYQNRVLEEVRNKLYEGISTREIYDVINGYLNQTAPSGSFSYNLKQAIMELGPSGYPFERYIGKLLEWQGFKTQVSIIIHGKCVSHEIDVLAEKPGEHYIVEAKFHNEHGIRSDIKVALYVYARYLDVLNSWLAKESPQQRNELHQAWLITNTKFSSDAIQYGQCVGMKLVGWNYPEKGNLQDLIEEAGLHPITSLMSLNQSQKQMLLERDIVLAAQLEKDRFAVSDLNLPREVMNRLYDELEALKNYARVEEDLR